MKNFFFLLLLITTAFPASAQDSHFSQQQSGLLWYNPSFTGTSGHARATSSFRDQWPGVTGNFVTSYLSYDQYFSKIKSGLGLSVCYDMAGQSTLNTLNLDVSYSYPILIDAIGTTIVPSAQIGYVSKTIDWSKLIFGDMIDPRRGYIYPPGVIPTEKSTSSGLNTGAGLLIYSKRAFAGFSATHLNQPDMGFYGESPLPVRYSAQAGVTLGQLPGFFDKRFSFTPGFLMYKQQDFSAIVPSFNVRFANFSLGAAYRLDDAVIGMLGYENPLFRVAYSYDYTISELYNSETLGSHEISLRFNLLKKLKPETFIAAPVGVF